jgi:hypothetical protein
MDDRGSDEYIKAQIDETIEFLSGLESGKLHIGLPAENRTEAKIADLKRQIVMWQSVLDRRDTHRP